jgi:hypothetical protein
MWKILRTDKNNNFKFTIKFLMTLDRSYIGYLGFLKWVFLQCGQDLSLVVTYLPVIIVSKDPLEGNKFVVLPFYHRKQCSY